MRTDLRPYWVKKAYLRFRDAYIDYFLRPRCSSLGPYANIMKPWYVDISGVNIRIGHSFTAVGEPSQRVQIGVWGREPNHGRISIGDGVLMSPGVRIVCSDEITIGDAVMMANGAYVTDCDWHGTYDRVDRPGKPTPVVIERNAWLGDGAKVLKGVTVGENSIVAAGAIVTKDVPSNVIVAGNPAVIVKRLDPDEPIRTRLDLYGDPAGAAQFYDAIDREVLANNKFLPWLMSVIYPRSRPD